MPFAGYEDFEACVADQLRKGHSDDSAHKICGSLKAKTEKMETDITKAKWTKAYMDSLPDSSFLYISPGGKKVDGKTTPKSLRHFPVKDKNGKIDAAHVRNALARIPQSNVPADAKARAEAKARRMLASIKKDDDTRITMLSDVAAAIAKARLIMKPSNPSGNIVNGIQASGAGQIKIHNAGKLNDVRGIKGGYGKTKKDDLSGSDLNAIVISDHGSIERGGVEDPRQGDDPAFCMYCGTPKQIDDKKHKHKNQMMKSMSVTLHKADKPDEEHYVLGVVLEPETEDTQHDVYSAEEIRKTAHNFMENFGNIGLQHKGVINEKAKILETYIAPANFELNGQTIQKGTWMLAARIQDDDLWQKVKKGDITGWSIGGSAVRTPVET